MMTRAWALALAGAALCAGAPRAAATGPDVIVGDLDETVQWTFIPVNGMRSYSVGTVSCNIGDAPLAWVGEGTQHPVIGQQMYRLHDGRIEQIGQSWLKHGICALQDELCGTCTPAGSFCEDALGVGCSDPYDVFLNGSQFGMGPKSEVNPATGGFSWPPTDFTEEGNAIYKRLQVRDADLASPDSLFFLEAQYIHPQDALAGNGNNNASYRRVAISGTASLVLQGPTVRMKPAIYAWRDHGGGIDVADPAVTLVDVDIPDDGRFIAGCKVTENGDGTWRYEYAVHNLNSNRAGGSFAVPLPAGAAITSVYFHDVDSHSGEPFDNTDWTVATPAGGSAGAITWSSPQTFTQNPNANALRWGTLYNFAFVADAPPGAGEVTLGLFRPAAGQPDGVSFTALVPGGAAPCIAERTGDDPPNVDVFDLLAYLDLWFDHDIAAELDGLSGVDVFDLLAYLDSWFAGC
jgi:hypothetical protein